MTKKKNLMGKEGKKTFKAHIHTSIKVEGYNTIIRHNYTIE